MNPNYIAYAAIHGRTIDQQLQFDAEQWPGGVMTGFTLWIAQQKQEAITAKAISCPN